MPSWSLHTRYCKILERLGFENLKNSCQWLKGIMPISCLLIGFEKETTETKSWLEYSTAKTFSVGIWGCRKSCSLTRFSRSPWREPRALQEADFPRRGHTKDFTTGSHICIIFDYTLWILIGICIWSVLNQDFNITQQAVFNCKALLKNSVRANSVLINAGVRQYPTCSFSGKVNTFWVRKGKTNWIGGALP